MDKNRKKKSKGRDSHVVKADISLWQFSTFLFPALETLESISRLFVFEKEKYRFWQGVVGNKTVCWNVVMLAVWPMCKLTPHMCFSSCRIHVEEVPLIYLASKTQTWLFPNPTAGLLNYSEILKSWLLSIYVFQWILRRYWGVRLRRSPAVTCGNTNYFNSSAITSTHIHPVGLDLSSGCELNSAVGIQMVHMPLIDS